MIIIINKSKLPGMVIAFAIVIFTALWIHQSMSDTASAFWSSAGVKNNAEVFDIREGHVIKTVPVSDSLLSETKKILKGITGFNLKVNVLPEKGYIVKIPFKHYIKVNNRWFNEYEIDPVDKVFIIFPEDTAPYLLVLDKKERPFLFNFDKDIDPLLKMLDFDLKKLHKE